MGLFRKDLALGQRFENRVIEHYKQFYSIQSTQDKGKFGGYDLRLESPDGGFLHFEVKYDRRAWQTKNVAIETKSKNREGEEWPSGLSVTKSDYYVFGFENIREVYRIRVERLRQLVDEKKYTKEIDFVGDGYACIVLFKLEDFIKECELVYTEEGPRHECNKNKQVLAMVRATLNSSGTRTTSSANSTTRVGFRGK